MRDLTLEFVEVGRDKKSWSVHCPFSQTNVEAIEDLAFREVQRKRVLMSREVDALYNAETNVGSVIVGGFRTVGHFSVKEAPHA